MAVGVVGVDSLPAQEEVLREDIVLVEVVGMVVLGVETVLGWMDTFLGIAQGREDFVLEEDKHQQGIDQEREVGHLDEEALAVLEIDLVADFVEVDLAAVPEIDQVVEVVVVAAHLVEIVLVVHSVD